VTTTQRSRIHHPFALYTDQSTEEAEILVTGIKVVDLLAPYAKAGKIGLFAAGPSSARPC